MAPRGIFSKPTPLSHKKTSPSASRGSAPPCLSMSAGHGSLPAPPLDAAFSSLFYFFDLSTCACSVEVTVTTVSLPPCVSHRGLFNTNHRLSRKKEKTLTVLVTSYSPTSFVLLRGILNIEPNQVAWAAPGGVGFFKQNSRAIQTTFPPTFSPSPTKLTPLTSSLPVVPPTSTS